MFALILLHVEKKAAKIYVIACKRPVPYDDNIVQHACAFPGLQPSH